ncbi:leucine-rich repeat-containing protein 51-like [Notolabrus celidotus]|uniref:leucine-rich repeat-containing protein 51-like n=1 Tax=Notolabrus celidotus TaxID=1203425 RepID=UPI00148F4CD5|nr:leucine-rich repeat-containing protein 51-like [Notolabrus celidotus]
MSGPPVDLSFKNLEQIAAAAYEVPQSSLRPLKINSEKKYLSKSMRLSNNRIQCLSGLDFVLNHFLAEPSKIGWLDLAFNQIKEINPILCELLELRVLYLHGNSIKSLREVDKLGKLQFLHTITLHGNPVELVKGYRKHVISVLPLLKKMDFSAVTQEERVLAKIWRHCKDRGKNTTESLQ